jgi:cell wall-associated NlpC family hydrolase
MKAAAAVAVALAALLVLPLLGVMFLGAPPPFIQHGSSSSCGKAVTATTVSVTTGGGGGSLPQNWNAVAQFLMSHGYSKNAAAGIDGNIESESGGNPEQLEIGGGGGTGLIQWTPASSAAPLQPIVTGNVSADLTTQLTDLLAYNAGRGQAAIATLNAEPTAGAAGAYYESAFEAPASLADAGTRSGNATAVLTALDKGTGGGGTVTTVSTTTPCASPKTATAGSVTPLATGKAAAAIAYAKQQLGKPYLFGGTGPDAFDCSGLVMMAWRAAGVDIPRTSEAQYAALPHITAAQAQPGDLIFYAGSDGTLSSPGHVVMYLGGGMVIQAFMTGTNIMINPLSFLTSSGLVGYARP